MQFSQRSANKTSSLSWPKDTGGINTVDDQALKVGF